MPQFTIRRLLLATAVIAGYLAVLRVYPPAVIALTAAGLLFALGFVDLWAADRLLGSKGFIQNAVGCLLVVVGIALFGFALLLAVWQSSR